MEEHVDLGGRLFDALLDGDRHAVEELRELQLIFRANLRKEEEAMSNHLNENKTKHTGSRRNSFDSPNTWKS